jgi:multiple sugar transport system permease protein
MTASGLYSQHFQNKKIRYLRNTILAVVLFFLAIVCLFPLFYMMANSFGPAGEMADTSRTVLPATWSLDSYKKFFSFSPYSSKWLINSLVVAISTVIGNVIFSSMAGYAFAKLHFKGSNFLFYLILVGMMIPYQVSQVPLYILIVNQFHISNTYTALFLPSLVTAYNIFLTKQFFTGIPTELIESAKLDGCNQLGVFVRIIVPLSQTILAVLAITTFLGSWNNFFWPFLVTSKESMYTIQVGLKQFKFANGALFGPMMAGASISAVPMFVLFFCLQKYFLEGVTVGAVKG